MDGEFAVDAMDECLEVQAMSCGGCTPTAPALDAEPKTTASDLALDGFAASLSCGGCAVNGPKLNE